MGRRSRDQRLIDEEIAKIRQVTPPPTPPEPSPGRVSAFKRFLVEEHAPVVRELAAALRRGARRKP